MERNIFKTGRRAVSPGGARFLVVISIALMILLSLSALLTAESYKLYVTHPNYYEDGRGGISIVNYANKEVIAPLLTTPSADKAVFVEKLNRLFVFSSERGVCEVFDPVIDRRITEFTTGGPVADVIFSLNGRRMYVANGSDSPDPKNTVTIIDTETGDQIFEIVAGRNPTALELSADGSLLYIADGQSGVVNVVELTNFQVLRSFYAGVSPSDLELSWDGRSLLVCSRSVSSANDAGAGIAVIDLGHENVAELVGTDGDIEKLALTENRVVVVETSEGRSNLILYDYLEDNGRIMLSRAGRIISAEEILDFQLNRSGNEAIASFANGTVKVYDLGTFSEKAKISELTNGFSGGLVLVPIDFARALARRDSLIASDPASDEARTAYFEKAYLYRSMCDKNSELKIYTELAEEFPRTETEVLSLLRLGDLCYSDMLYANSAEFYSRAFDAYTGVLEQNAGVADIDQSLLMTAVRRLGEFSAEYDKDYLKSIMSRLETLSVSSGELAELFFEIAYYLKKQGDTRLARRSLDEVERQMINIQDKNLYKRLRNKIDLLESKGRVVLIADKVKNGPLIDGDMADWEDKHTLFVDRRTDVLVNSERWVDDRDLSVELRAAYDRESLYLLGVVTDDSVFSSDIEKQDKFILYFDMRENSGDFLQRKSEASQGLARLEIIPAVSPEGRFDISHSPEIQPIFAGKLTEKGYVVELKIPFAYFKNIGPDNEKSFGFGFEIMDADSDLTRDPVKVMGWVAPAESLNGSRDYRMLGILDFD